MSTEIVEAWITNEDIGENGNAHHLGLRAAVGESYASLPNEHLESMLEARLASMSPEDAEDFLSALGGFGKMIAPIAGKVLPVAAPLLGSVIGGPIGGMVGNMAGQWAGQALGGVGGGGGGGAPAPRPPMAPPQPAPAPAPPGAGGPASMQLLSFLQNPQLLQSILGQVMGPTGRGSVPVGSQGSPAPFGGFMNALSVLANQAASEAEPEDAEDQESLPEYLLDGRGRPRCDPAVPEERAAVLLQRLREIPSSRYSAPLDPASWVVASVGG